MLSIFDIFKIGIGPSSSHTVGPMKASADFADRLHAHNLFGRTARVAVELYGSLALTGLGHATFDAVLLGLESCLPHSVALEDIPVRLERIRRQNRLLLGNSRELVFDTERDLIIHYDESLPKHPNGMRCLAYDADGNLLLEQVYYSIGGGFIVTDQEYGMLPETAAVVPFPFRNMAELKTMCQDNGKTIAEIVLANETAISGQNENEVRQRVAQVAQVMFDCVDRGLKRRGELPGGLHVRRRAPALAEKMHALRESGQLNSQLWPMIYAMAVNEENAAGGRVVTAPTNGAAGIIPSVLYYYRTFHPLTSQRGIENFLLVAGAIGILYKTNASISGAEVGCQGEVGVACSMAAGAFSAVSGGTVSQIENAAEMAMEHHLGLTCDPVGGLVQIPCIERNGIAAEKAIKLAQLSLLEDGENKKVPLDTVIKTMLQTGLDMKTTYKETSLAGLAVTVQKHAIPISVGVAQC